jgi:hypothetical protein
VIEYKIILFFQIGPLKREAVMYPDTTFETLFFFNYKVHLAFDIGMYVCMYVCI